jgi:murein L,D-transpeptidase YafK
LIFISFISILLKFSKKLKKFSSVLFFTLFSYIQADFHQTTSISDNIKTISLPNKKTYIIIHGESYILEVYDRNNELIYIFPVGLGENGLGKTEKKDKKTPCGEYEIIWKASIFFEEDGGLPITETLGYCGNNNTYYVRKPQEIIKIRPLLNDAYGGKRAVFMCLNYPNSSDQSKGYTGSGIGIHASLLGGIEKNSSAGCIRMHPEDARKLYNYVKVGSKVFIKAD